MADKATPIAPITVEQAVTDAYLSLELSEWYGANLLSLSRVRFRDAVQQRVTELYGVGWHIQDILELASQNHARLDNEQRRLVYGQKYAKN